MQQFANILFAGPCNAFCPDCIGKQVDASLSVNNLDTWPLKNLDSFIKVLNKQNIKEVSLTGTTTDPLLYKHQQELIACLHTEVPGCKISLHTNGRLLKKTPEALTLYDRVAISIPSFHDDIYQILMGTSGIPDIENIIKKSPIPIKISTLVSDINRHDILGFIRECHRKGVKRLVLRKLFGEPRSLYDMIDSSSIAMQEKGVFMNNKVFDYHDMEVTFWEFENTENICYNLFSDGTISDQYILTETKKNSCLL